MGVANEEVVVKTIAVDIADSSHRVAQIVVVRTGRIGQGPDHRAVGAGKQHDTARGAADVVVAGGTLRPVAEQQGADDPPAGVLFPQVVERFADRRRVSLGSFAPVPTDFDSETVLSCQGLPNP